ncbi:alpha/beta hydrolase [Streptococcus cameli]
MAIFKIEYNSQALKQYREAVVIYPDSSEVTDKEAVDTDIPVLYLLHGMNGNQNSWTHRTNLERLVRHTNIIIVMPNCDNGWYTNTASGIHYFDAIAIELPQIMRRFFPNMTTKREKTFIAGLSMGGYGALKIAFETNQYSWAGSFSGALVGKDVVDTLITDDFKYWEGIFGDLKDEKNREKFYLSTSFRNFDGKTKCYAWCGEGDFLYEANNQTVADLQEAGLDIEYVTEPGTHEWYYWEKQIEIFLRKLPIPYVEEERLS